MTIEREMGGSVAKQFPFGDKRRCFGATSALKAGWQALASKPWRKRRRLPASAPTVLQWAAVGGNNHDTNDHSGTIGKASEGGDHA
ncbi:hypothetical protein H6F86_05450 [Phormidium sp. FACHB-592]|uniref:Uncharacterized protein n=1 Tax=Stenomitos frigidus AS-A4 TaxID=2933935 RepID=A0ABV0KRT2_9CYAN|nr:hypothetical protein [Phormidium sp. FACHB-592]MBD2073337.1 hypothetical protein [Phormidium sp. FACHB-592]